MSLVASGFFVLRTPVLDLLELRRLSEDLRAPSAAAGELAAALDHDIASAHERLLRWAAVPSVRTALSTASQSFFAEVVQQPANPRVASTLFRYFTRMAGRPTPQGLFAGTSFGRVTSSTRLELTGDDRRQVRVELNVLEHLRDELLADRSLRRSVPVRANTTWDAPGHLRFIATSTAGGARRFELSQIARTAALDLVLDGARVEVTLDALSSRLLERYPEAASDSIRDFLDGLVDARVLIPCLLDNPTGGEPLDELIRWCEATSSTRRTAESLIELRDCLREAERDASRIEAATAAVVGILPTAAPTDLSRALRIDLWRGARATLGPSVIREIKRAIDLLGRIGADSPTETARERFRAAFVERYGEREVPLLEALDDESGIPFDPDPGNASDPSELLTRWRSPRGEQPAFQFGARDAYRLRRFSELLARGSNTWELDRGDERGLAGVAHPLPDAVAFKGALCCESPEHIDQGDFQLVVDGIVGPSGARLLGRACALDGDLERAVRDHLAAEQAARPDVLFAEIVHVPGGHAGNVILRPRLRDAEIPVLARPSASALELSDLRVSVRGETIVLRSSALDRIVAPRLSTAHDHGKRENLGIYRFLCALQDQGVVSRLRWSWGVLESAEALPRVTSGRLVLARARWSIGWQRFAAEATREQRYKAFQRWRAACGAPRYVVLLESDQRLPLDLDHVICVETLLQRARTRGHVAFSEMLPGPFDQSVTGSAGGFAHELVVPFHARTSRRSRALTSVVTSVERTFPPGSRWLYFRVFASANDAERLLRETIAPAIAAARSSVVRWFYVRFGDPTWHLRVRIEGEPADLARLRSELEARLAVAIRGGGALRFEVATYEREVERYGGTSIETCEAMFGHDTEAITRVLPLVTDDVSDVLRWRIAIRGLDGLFACFELDLETRIAWLRSQRDGLLQEAGHDTDALRHLGARFREHVEELGALTGPTPPLPDDATAALLERDAALRPLAANIRAAIPADALRRLVMSLTHMHVNRLFVRAHREKELVLYDWLQRMYSARRSREEQSS